MDMSEDLARRIKNQFHHYTDYQQFCELLKTKELTYTRISRALLHTVLGIKQNRTDAFLNDQVHYYAHLLGFRKDPKQILSETVKSRKSHAQTGCVCFQFISDPDIRTVSHSF